MDDCDEDHAWLVELFGFDEAQMRLTGTCSPCKKQKLGNKLAVNWTWGFLNLKREVLLYSGRMGGSLGLGMGRTKINLSFFLSFRGRLVSSRLVVVSEKGVK